MKTIKKTIMLMLTLVCLSVFFACEEDDCEEVRDLDGNIIGCIDE